MKSEEAGKMVKVMKENKMSKSTKTPDSPKLSRPTISTFVVDELSKDPTMDAETLIQKVHKTFPWSHFQKSHVTWYKYQIRQGRYQLKGGKQLPPPRSKKKKVAEAPKKAKVAKSAKAVKVA